MFHVKLRSSFVLLIVLVVAGCGSRGNQSLQNDQTQTNTQLQQYQAVQPVPFYNWSEQRNTLIQIYNAKNEARNTWAVVESITGVALWACPSVGFPIPADTQLTNPQQLAATNYPNAAGWVEGVVPQMEPDGLYSSTNTDATYILCVRPNGKIVPIYTEQKVSMFPFAVTVQDGKIVDSGGDTNIEVTVKGSSAAPAPTPSPNP